MNMNKWLLCFAVFAGTSAQAASYNFDVNYFGNGNAMLVAGSDDPTASTLIGGDDFNWTITAQNDGEWLVVAPDSQGYFPLMAFGTQEDGKRNSDFTLTLKNNGSEVFSLSQTGSEQFFVHMGTNTVVLDSGLVFDQMLLNYTLNFALSEDGLEQPIGSTPTGLLPIFGAPEQNESFPGIIYSPVPEPTSGLLLLAGLAGLGWVAKKRRA